MTAEQKNSTALYYVLQHKGTAEYYTTGNNWRVALLNAKLYKGADAAYKKQQKLKEQGVYVDIVVIKAERKQVYC